MREAGPRRVRIGVIGTGVTSQLLHLPILTERGDVDVEAVSDLDEVKARAVADRFGVPRVLSDDEIVAAREIEGVVICAPSFLHESFAAACLEAGKHVLIERPLALSSGGVRRLLEVAQATGKGVVLGLSHRYQANVRALRSAVAEGALGELGTARVEWLHRAVRRPRTGWRRRALESGGGALMDLGVPALDLALWVLGFPEVERVTATTRGDGFDVEEEAHVHAVTRDGVAVTLTASWRFHAPEDRHRFWVLGSEGAARLSPLSIYKQIGGRTVDITPRQPIPRGGEDQFTNGYRRLLDEFVRVCRGNRCRPTARRPDQADEAHRGRVRVGARGSRGQARLMSCPGADPVPPGSAVRTRLFFAAVSGLAIGATFSPHGGPVLPFLAFAPLAAALARTARDAAAPPLAPFAQGFAAAVVAHAIGLYWMVPSLSWRTPLAVPTYLLVLLLIGVVAGAACGAATFLHGRKGWPLPLVLAACWTGFE